MTLDAFDAVLLPDPDWAATNEWWQDAIRALLADAHEFYQDQHNDRLAEANARAKRCESVVKNLHLLGLVIESAVRHADIQHHAAVLALVKAARQALPPDPQEPEGECACSDPEAMFKEPDHHVKFVSMTYPVHGTKEQT